MISADDAQRAADMFVQGVADKQKHIDRVTNLRKELRQANKAIRERDKRIERLVAQVAAERSAKMFWYQEHNKIYNSKFDTYQRNSDEL